MSSSRSQQHAVLQLGYVGSQGHRLWRFFDLSQPSQAQITAFDCRRDAQTCANTPDAISAAIAVPGLHGFTTCRELHPNFYTFIVQENSTGKSNYNALQTSFRITDGMVSLRSRTTSGRIRWTTPATARTSSPTLRSRTTAPTRSSSTDRQTSTFRTASPGTSAYDLPKMGGSMQKLKNGWGINSIAHAAEWPAVPVQLQLRRRLQRQRQRL